jgi:CBS domain-containing protein
MTETSMKISEYMTRYVRLANPQQTIRDAAQVMAELDAGAVPVGEDDRLVGMITDRDIAIRAVATGRPPETPISEVMTEEVDYCFEDDDVRDVLRNMGEIQVRRLLVLDRDKRLVGIVSVGDIAVRRPDLIGNTIAEISDAIR